MDVFSNLLGFWHVIVIILLSVVKQSVCLGSCSVWRWGCSVWSIWCLRHVSPPGAAFETMQTYTVSVPPYWDGPLLSVITLNNGVTLLFLVKYESMYISVKRQLWRKTLSCPVRSCAVKNGALWKMKKKVSKMSRNTSWSLDKTAHDAAFLS